MSMAPHRHVLVRICINIYARRIRKAPANSSPNRKSLTMSMRSLCRVPRTTDTFQPPSLLRIAATGGIPKGGKPPYCERTRPAPEPRHQAVMQFDLVKAAAILRTAQLERRTCTYRSRILRYVFIADILGRGPPLNLLHLHAAEVRQPDLPQALLPVASARHSSEEAFRAPRRVVAGDHQRS